MVTVEGSFWQRVGQTETGTRERLKTEAGSLWEGKLKERCGRVVEVMKKVGKFIPRIPTLGLAIGVEGVKSISRGIEAAEDKIANKAIDIGQKAQSAYEDWKDRRADWKSIKGAERAVALLERRQEKMIGEHVRGVEKIEGETPGVEESVSQLEKGRERYGKTVIARKEASETRAAGIKESLISKREALLAQVKIIEETLALLG
jgi:ribosomal protein L24